MPTAGRSHASRPLARCCQPADADVGLSTSFGAPDAFASLTAQTADDRDPDPELAEYNDYLAKLNARTERAR